MALEDFTTYTELDTDEKLTVGENQIDFAELDMDDEAAVYKDVGLFGDFKHRFKIHIASIDAGGPRTVFWGVATGTNFTHNDHEQADDGIACLAVQSTDGLLGFSAYDTPGGSDIHTYEGTFSDFTRWIEVERAGTTFTLKIYTDAYSTLEDTLTKEVPITAFRYVNGVASTEYDGFTGRTMTGYTADLNLLEAGEPPSVSVKKNFNLTTKPIINMTSDPSTGMGSQI